MSFQAMDSPIWNGPRHTVSSQLAMLMEGAAVQRIQAADYLKITLTGLRTKAVAWWGICKCMYTRPCPAMAQFAWTASVFTITDGTLFESASKWQRGGWSEHVPFREAVKRAGLPATAVTHTPLASLWVNNCLLSSQDPRGTVGKSPSHTLQAVHWSLFASDPKLPLLLSIPECYRDVELIRCSCKINILQPPAFLGSLLQVWSWLWRTT